MRITKEIISLLPPHYKFFLKLLTLMFFFSLFSYFLILIPFSYLLIFFEELLFNISNRKELYNAYFLSLLNNSCLLQSTEPFAFLSSKSPQRQDALSLTSLLPHPHLLPPPPGWSWVPPRCGWRNCTIHLAGFYHGIIQPKHTLGNLNS